MQRVKRTRNGGRMSEAAFWGMFNRDIDKRLMYWRAGDDYLNTLRKKDINPLTGRSIYIYPCEICGKWFDRDHVERDHRVSVGKITCVEDFKKVIDGKFIEADSGGWQCLCVDCHLNKSNTEKFTGKRK